MPLPRMTSRPIRSLIKGGIRRVCAEDGAVTVEAALWLPFFVAILTLVADAALIFYGQARTLQVTQDANRAFSTGAIQTPAEVATYIRTALAPLSHNVSATTNFNDGLITTVVNVPTRDLSAVGFFSSLTTGNMQVVAEMVREF